VAVKDYIRKRFFPHIWCQGCGHGIVLNCMLRAFDQLGISKNEIVMVSGIGCSSRISGYVDFHTLHTLHGRALAFATGVKISMPDLNVIVPMGDGDALAIGGNHFIHAARRNIDLLVILVNNFIYGMTGGQNAPTTPPTARSSTMPYGNFEPPFSLPHLATSSGASYVARWTCLHVRRLTRAFEEAIKRKGFRFIEVIAPCSTLYARLNKIGTGLSLMKFYHDNSEIRHGADLNEVGIDYQSKITVGKFLDIEKPTYLEALNRHNKKVFGDKYKPYGGGNGVD